MERKPSEIITDFLSFIEQSYAEYEAAYAEAGKEDGKIQTFLHDIEFAKSRNERNKIAIQLQQSRRMRRKAKDRALLYENIHSFCVGKQNKNLLKTLRHLQNEQCRMEKYLFGNRKFKKRIDYEQ